MSTECPLIPTADRLILKYLGNFLNNSSLALPDTVTDGLHKYEVIRLGPGKRIIHDGSLVTIPLSEYGVEIGDVFVLPAALKPSHKFGSSEYVIASFESLPARFPRDGE